MCFLLFFISSMPIFNTRNAMNSIRTVLLAMKRELTNQKLTIALLFLFSAGQGLLYSQDLGSTAAVALLDGTASVALRGELPDTGFFAASNRFPLNTTVNVTNLNNGKMTQVVVTKGLEASGDGCLITLSRDAASAIEIYNRDIGRVRVTLPDIFVPFFPYHDGRGFSGGPDYDPGVLLTFLLFYRSIPVYSPLPAEVIEPFITEKTDTTDVAASVDEDKPISVETSRDIVLEAPLPILDDSFWRR
jgi:hypothetical protein